MFGYVRVLEGELKINDYGIYKGVYCGLCKTMKRRTGISSTFTLSYDLVFLALLRAALNGEGFTVRAGKCALHPIKKRPIAKENNALGFTAGASAVLTYYKLKDDESDGDAKKRIAVKAALPHAKRYVKRACKAFPEYRFDLLSDKVSAKLNELSQLENANCPSVDRCAELFGELLAEVFAHGIDDETTAKHCYELGLSMGRWIYISDAADDFEKDKKKKSYNPFLCAGFEELPKELIYASLGRECENAKNALCALDIKYDDIKRILANVIVYGMPSVSERILEKEKGKKKPSLPSETV